MYILFISIKNNVFFIGKGVLYARLDRKPIKSVEKKLKKYFSKHKKWLEDGKQVSNVVIESTFICLFL